MNQNRFWPTDTSLDIFPAIDLLHNGSSSDDDTDLSSHSSCDTATDGLDSFIFDIPELVLPPPSPADIPIENNRLIDTLNAPLLDKTNDQTRSKKTTPNDEEISFNHTLRKHSIPDQMKDEKYWKRRVRNNRSAKKSREAKRAQDDIIKSRMAFLETENNQLKMLVSKLLSERNNVSQNYSTLPVCYNR